MAMEINPLEKQLSDSLIKAAEQLEDKLDAELQELEDLDRIRDKRLKELEEMARLQTEWISLGHGEYEELADEKSFFATTKKSKNVICHFFKSEVFLCKVVDHHLKALSKRHIEAKICKIDGSRCKFLVDKLAVKTFPTIICIVDSMVKCRITNFEDVKQCEPYSTGLLEWHIAHSGAISYNGDLNAPPEKQATKKKQRRGIRGKYDDDDSDDSDF